MRPAGAAGYFRDFADNSRVEGGFGKPSVGRIRDLPVIIADEINLSKNCKLIPDVVN